MNSFANTLIVTGLLTIALLGQGWVIHTILMGTPAPMIGRGGTWVVAAAMVVLLGGILFKYRALWARRTGEGLRHDGDEQFAP